MIIRLCKDDGVTLDFEIWSEVAPVYVIRRGTLWAMMVYEAQACGTPPLYRETWVPDISHLAPIREKPALVQESEPELEFEL